MISYLLEAERMNKSYGGAEIKSIYEPYAYIFIQQDICPFWQMNKI